MQLFIDVCILAIIMCACMNADVGCPAFGMVCVPKVSGVDRSTFEAQSTCSSKPMFVLLACPAAFIDSSPPPLLLLLLLILPLRLLPLSLLFFIILTSSSWFFFLRFLLLLLLFLTPEEDGG